MCISLLLVFTFNNFHFHFHTELFRCMFPADVELTRNSADNTTTLQLTGIILIAILIINIIISAICIISKVPNWNGKGGIAARQH